MNRNQQSKMRMYRNVRRLLENNPTAWANIPAFADAFGRFTGLTDQILVTNTEQRIAITGHAVARKQLRAELDLLLLQVSGALQSLARKTGNSVLLHNVRIAPSRLASTGEARHQAYRNRLVREATTHLADLADFAITQAQLDLLQTKIDAYETLVLQPRQAILERSKRTARLVDLFDKADEVLKGEMDPMLPLLAAQDAELARAYRAARNIIRYGSRPASGSEVDIGSSDGL